MKILTTLFIIGSFFGNNSYAQDLVIQEIILSNAYGTIGQTISPIVRISNIGLYSTKASKVGFYISKDSSLTHNDTFLGNSYCMPLIPGANNNLITTLTLPATLNPGAYFLFAFADYEGLVLESNEKNNSRHTKINLSTPSKDLSIKSFFPNKNTFASGDIFSASVIEYNSGNSSVKANNIGYYISTDNVVDSKDVLLGIDSIGLVLANDETIDLPSFYLPSNLPIGGYYIIAIADYGNNNIESNEHNNAMSTKISIIPAVADMNISAFNSEVDSAIRGRRFSATSTLSNGGNIFLRNLTVGYYLSTDSVLNIGDTFLSNSHFDYLYSGDYAADYPSFLIPSDTPLGNYYLLAVADYDNTIDETFEENNVQSLRIKITAPTFDLSIYRLSVVPTNTAADSYLNADLYEFNWGNTDAPSHSLYYFLSTDSIYDLRDIFLSSSYIRGVSPENFAYLKPPLYIPSAVPNGNYYIIAIADYLDEIEEIDENNNIQITPITISSPSYDLSISCFTPYLITSAGSYVYPKLVEDDFGNGFTMPHYVGYFLSLDSIHDPSDIFLANDSLLGTYGGSSIGLNPSLRIPANVPNGLYFILAISDYQLSVPEANKSNNIIYIHTIVVPAFTDLSSSFLSSDSLMVIAGTSFSTTIVQHNNGTTFASNFSVGYFISSDSIYDRNDTFLSDESINGTIINSYTYLNPSISIPLTQIPGDYYVLAVSDYLSEIEESNESNNYESLKIHVNASGIDLTIESLSTVDLTPASGSFIYLNYTEANEGNLNAYAHYIGYFLSTDSIYDNNDTYLSADYLSFLKGGEKRTLNPALYIPNSVTYGNYYIIIASDYGNNLVEINEDNNTKALLVTIGTPSLNVDLSLSYFYVESDSICPGSSLTINFNEYNSGTSSADGHNISYFLSPDSSFSTDDAYLGYEYVYGVTAGTNYSHATSLDIPYTSALGHYYLVAISDYGNQILETNEDNNTSFIPIVIVEPIIASEAVSIISKSNIEIYPNPSNGIVYFNTLDNADEIEVSDINQHVLLNRTTSTSMEEPLNLGSLSSGIYLVKTKKKGTTTSINKIAINY